MNAKRHATTRQTTPAPLIEGEDFYMENGLLVFTARYHLRRGFCCGNKCRHCPYDKVAIEKGNAKR